MTVFDVLKDNPGLGRAEALRRTMLCFSRRSVTAALLRLFGDLGPLLARRRGALAGRDIGTHALPVAPRDCPDSRPDRAEMSF
jgi:hypothetical protein